MHSSKERAWTRSTHLVDLCCTASFLQQVESSDPHARGLAGQYTDDSQVDKFELTEEEYAARRGAPTLARSFASNPADPSRSPPSTRQSRPFWLARTDTVLAYKKRNQLGRFAPSASPSPASPAPLPADLVPGARCQVALSPELSRRGTVRFVGPTEFGTKDGSTWVGVEWDEPVGKNDGACVPLLVAAPSTSISSRRSGADDEFRHA